MCDPLTIIIEEEALLPGFLEILKRPLLACIFLIIENVQDLSKSCLEPEAND